MFFNSATTGSFAVDYDSAAVKMVITYRDQGNSNYGTYVTATVSGENITFSSETVFESAYTDHTWVTFDASSNSNLISYRDSGNTDNGTGIVLQNSYSSTNLTAENYIGMSRGVVEQTTVAQAAGTPVTFESGNAVYTSVDYDANAQKVVIAYRDSGNSNYGTAVVGTVNASTNSISFGTPVVFFAGETSWTTVAYDANAQKVLIAYQDRVNNDYGAAIVGTVSGTSISFGTPTIFSSISSTALAATYDSTAQKIVVVCSRGASSPAGFVGTISGTSVSFGSGGTYGGTNDNGNAITYDANANKVVVVYRDGGDTQGKSSVGTVSGTSISFGSEAVFDSGSVGEYTGITYDASVQKVVVAYVVSNTGYAKVGTVSGTSISYASSSSYSSTANSYVDVAYDSNAESVAIFYRDSSPFYGKAVSGKVSGTSISFSSELTFQSGRSQWMSAAYDTNAQKIVVAYQDYAASTGDAVVFQTGYTATDRSPVADGDPARMDIIGSVSDNQLSLTAGEKYYVQTDGTISTTAGDPSVLAGTAISATKLVVKT